MLRRVAVFCRPLRPVLLLVSFPRSRSPVVGVPGVAGCAVCASAAPNSWRIGGCAGCCRGRLTVFAAHTPPLPPPPSRRGGGGVRHEATVQRDDGSAPCARQTKDRRTEWGGTESSRDGRRQPLTRGLGPGTARAPNKHKALSIKTTSDGCRGAGQTWRWSVSTLARDTHFLFLGYTLDTHSRTLGYTCDTCKP